MSHDFQILIGPRPGKKSKKSIEDMGTTHILTLLCEKEDACSIAKISKQIGAKWMHFPIEGGKLETLEKIDLEGLFDYLELYQLNAQSRVYVHCSAGIHRTGFVVYLLLRRQGHSDESAKLEMTKIRQVTADQVGDERLNLAQKMFDRLSK